MPEAAATSWRFDFVFAHPYFARDVLETGSSCSLGSGFAECTIARANRITRDKFHENAAEGLCRSERDAAVDFAYKSHFAIVAMGA